MSRGDFTLWKLCCNCGTMNNGAVEFCRGCNVTLFQEINVKREDPAKGG